MANKNINVRSPLWEPLITFPTVPGPGAVGGDPVERVFHIKPPGSGYFRKAWMHCGTIGSSGTLSLDVEINNTTIFTTNPTVTAAGTAGTGTLRDAKMTSTALAFDENDVIRIEVTQTTANVTSGDVSVGLVAVLTNTN